MKASLNTLHHQDSDWLRELDFYKEETSILTKRLEEIVSKNTAQDIRAGIEHLQNRFILLRERHDILAHNIRTREDAIEELAKEKPEHITEHTNKVNDKIHADIKEFAATFADTRFELNQFLAKYL